MIEIQIHPSDIRRKVRYLFVGERAVGVGVIGGSVLLFLVVASLAVAPTVIRRMYSTTSLHLIRQQQAVEVERLKHHIEEMAVLEKDLDRQRLEIEKLVTVYGLAQTVMGQGGIDSAPLTVGDGGVALRGARRREQQLRDAIARLNAQVQILHRHEKEHAHLVRHVPSILPLPAAEFVLTSPFGSRISPFTRRADSHRGLDFAAAKGTPVFSTADGVVTFAGRYPLRQNVSWWRFGNVVVVNHADRFMTIYAHLDEVRVRSGQAVRQGDIIASVGNSGWSTNPHLHYEVRSDLERKGEYRAVDPRIYILDYHWSDEENLLARSRSGSDVQDFDPLPTAFLGRRRV